MGVHSAVNHGFNFLVRLSSRLQVNAHEQFPVYPVARVRDVPLVFFERKYFERDAFRNRKFVPREKNCFPRGAVADCENYFRAGRAHFFCRRAVRDVRGLRLPALDLQPADNLLFLRDDLPVVGRELVDKFADGLHARRGTTCRHALAIRFLGHADFLELKNASRTVPNFFETQSRLLRRRRLSAVFHLSRMVLGTRALDGVLLARDGGGHAYRRVVFQKIAPAFRRRALSMSIKKTIKKAPEGAFFSSRIIISDELQCF